MSMKNDEMLLCDKEKVAAIEFLCGLAETFSSFELLTADSSTVHQDCILHLAKDGFYAMLFCGKLLQTFRQFLGGTVIVPTKN